MENKFRPWGVHTLASIFNPHCESSPDGERWYMAVASPYWGGRLRAAWWVLTGRAFALQWPEPGDLERAIYDDCCYGGGIGESERRKRFEALAADLPTLTAEDIPMWTDEDIALLRAAGAVRFDELFRTEALFYVASTGARIAKRNRMIPLPSDNRIDGEGI